MTLVFPLVTPENVVLVADRRLTFVTGPNAGTVKEDQQNKMLVVCNRMVFAYTGLAELEGSNTDDWLLDVVENIVPYNPKRVLQAVAKRATEAMRKAPVSRELKRHAFVAIGWAQFEKDEPLRPFMAVVSNSLDGSLRWLTQPNEEFRVLGPRALGKDEPYLLTSLGVPLLDPEAITTVRVLERILKRTQGSLAMVRFLVMVVRTVADRLGRVSGPVGSNVLATVLPRSALSHGPGLSMILGNSIPTDTAFSLYFPADASVPVWFAPNYTCLGMSMKGGWAVPGTMPRDEISRVVPARLRPYPKP